MLTTQELPLSNSTMVAIVWKYAFTGFIISFLLHPLAGAVGVTNCTPRRITGVMRQSLKLGGLFVNNLVLDNARICVQELRLCCCHILSAG